MVFINKLFCMRLLETIRRVLLEYIEDNSEILYETKVKNKDFVYYDSSHLYYERPSTGNIRFTKKDRETLETILQQTSYELYTRYWRMNKHLPDIDMEDPKKIRFVVRKTINGEEVAVLLQIEELDRKKGMTCVIITYFDEKGLKLRGGGKFEFGLR